MLPETVFTILILQLSFIYIKLLILTYCHYNTNCSITRDGHIIRMHAAVITKINSPFIDIYSKEALGTITE